MWLPYTFNSFSIPILNSPIAQLVEQLTVNQWVPGSSPGRGAKQNESRLRHCSKRLFFA